MTFTIDLSEAEAAKLQELSDARGKTPEQCIRDFIAACVPGGSEVNRPAPPTVRKDVEPR